MATALAAMDGDVPLDLAEFASEVGSAGAVTIGGAGTHGGPVAGVRAVTAPVGVQSIAADEMTVCCGAGTLVEDLDAALAEHGQAISLPPGGTVGGALAVGHSGIRRLGDGPVRDTLLQARYVNAAGEVVKAGGPTVKNVTGFDVCRLLVGSWGTLGFLGEVILRSRPRPRHSQWFTSGDDPHRLLADVYRPTSVLWNGTTTWMLLEGEPADVEAAARRHRFDAVDAPPRLPTGGRWSLPPSQLDELSGEFVAEVGVGIVHSAEPAPQREVAPAVRELNRRIKHNFDPTGRLNPGVDVLAPRDAAHAA